MLFWKIFSSSVSSAIYIEVQQWELIIKQYVFIPRPCPERFAAKIQVSLGKLYIKNKVYAKWFN